MNTQKLYISADQLLCDSFALALEILDSDWHPDLIVGVWRGGTPVAIAVHEALGFAGRDCDHIAIRAASYRGIDERGEVGILGLETLHGRLSPRARVLLVDDVYDSGRTMLAILRELQACSGSLQPDLRIAVPYFKPGRNTTTRRPDYFLHVTEDWLVFPHELDGLDDAELLQKPGLESILKRLLRQRTLAGADRSRQADGG